MPATNNRLRIAGSLQPHLSPRQPIHYRFGLADVAVGGLVLIGCYFALASLVLAIRLERALPYFDQWVFVVNDYFSYLDGTYSWTQLFAPHGEHRIATARIVLFADAFLFHMTGWLPLFVQFAALGTIAFLIAKLATRTGKEFAAALPLALGLMWSISQFENLSWAFQTCFPLVHLFAVCTVIAFARSLEDAAWRGWLAIACVADALAVFSLGSGLFVIAPVFCVAIWMRQLDRQFLVFAVLHTALAASYLSGGLPTSAFGYVASLAATFPDQLAQFLGASFGGWPPPELGAGYCGMIALMIALGAATWHTITDTRPLERNSAILLSIALFVMAEAVVTAIGRASMGVGPRYATAAVVFECALLGFYFRQSSGPGPLARVGVTVIAVIAVIGANGWRNETAWISKITVVDRATEEFRSGKFDPATAWIIWPGLRPEWLERYVALQLGPYR
jgi:hypothetical protein